MKEDKVFITPVGGRRTNNGLQGSWWRTVLGAKLFPDFTKEFLNELPVENVLERDDEKLEMEPGATIGACLSQVAFIFAKLEKCYSRREGLLSFFLLEGQKAHSVRLEAETNEIEEGSGSWRGKGVEGGGSG